MPAERRKDTNTTRGGCEINANTKKESQARPCVRGYFLSLGLPYFTTIDHVHSLPSMPWLTRSIETGHRTVLPLFQIKSQTGPLSTSNTWGTPSRTYVPKSYHQLYLTGCADPRNHAYAPERIFPALFPSSTSLVNGPDKRAPTSTSTTTHHESQI